MHSSLLMDSDFTSSHSGHSGTNGVKPEDEEEHRKKFADARKAHYNMKDALAHKVEEDEEEEEHPLQVSTS
jgi:hypothetical protein